MLNQLSYDKLVREGVFKECALNQSANYHILNNFAFDLTHDLWLGVVQNELSLVLTSLIETKLFSLEN